MLGGVHFTVTSLREAKARFSSTMHEYDVLTSAHWYRHISADVITEVLIYTLVKFPEEQSVGGESYITEA